MIDSSRIHLDSPKRRTGRHGHVLIVDDNVDYLQTLELLLEGTGFHCRFCTDGPSAIEEARREEFDVLLTDVRMSPLDGVDTARAVKIIQPLIAVIMMTGFDKEDTPIEALRLGAVDYIDKPIADANAFLRLLEQHVNLALSSKQIKATTERLETVIEQVDAGVIVLDSQGTIEEINQAAQRVVAPGTNHPVGQKLHDVCEVPEILHATQTEEVVHQTFERLVDGERRLYQIAATQLSGPAGRFAGSVLLIKDLTGIAQWQKAEGWRQMSRAITHGMKTPLATLRMRLERLRGKPECADVEGEFGMLLRIVEDLHARLRDMVDLVKLDITPALTDVNDTVGAALRHFETNRQPGLQLEFRKSPGPLVLPHSSAAIGLAIENLIANSQEAGAHSVLVELSAVSDEERLQAVIEITDDGPGIPPELQSQIFNAPLNSTKPGGSGLGTALVKYIIDQHHGVLVWQSPTSAAGGTRVTLRLLLPSPPSSD